MKKSLLVAIAVGCFLLGSHAFASTAVCNPKKVYVDKHAVKISKKGFLIDTGNELIKVKMLRSDSKGVYILKNDAIFVKHPDDYYPVQCPGCHRWCRSEREMMNHRCIRESRKK